MTPVILLSIAPILLLPASACAALPPDYKGRPFADPIHSQSPAVIPGKLECACFDFGGEGIAYHSDGTNHGSGELNRRPALGQTRASASPTQRTLRISIIRPPCLLRRRPINFTSDGHRMRNG
jgi:hypothetical protein